jgi:hypothetical protein
MKKKLLTIALFSLVNKNQIFGQEKMSIVDHGPRINFCGAIKDNDSVKFSELLLCNGLTLEDSNLNSKADATSSDQVTSQIISFQIGFSEDGMYKAIKNIGSKFSKETLEFLKHTKDKKIQKVYVDEIITLDSKTKEEIKMSGISISLE